MDWLKLQKFLASLGLYKGNLDGKTGPLTREAVKAWQRQAGLTADGIVGPQTRAALTAAGVFPKVVSIAPGESRNSREINVLFWHCTATPEGVEYTVAQITAMHRARGFNTIGYHRLFHLDGDVSQGRPDSVAGAHVENFNARSLGFSYVGGVVPHPQGKKDKNGRIIMVPKDTRTPRQKAAMLDATRETIAKYKLERVLGHRDVSPDRDGDGVVESHEWIKVCPCFSVAADYGHLLR